MKRKWALKGIFLVLLSSFAIGIAVSAAKIPDILDTGRQCKLSIDAGEASAGESMAIYRVGEINQAETSLQFVLTDSFSASGADISSSDSKTRSAAIQALEQSAKDQKPSLTFQLNDQGKITLSVPMGVYLVMDGAENDIAIQSGLISVPQVNEEQNNWSYEATLDLKAGVESPSYDSPKTADSAQILLFSCIATISLGQIALMLWARKKLKKEALQ